MCGHAGCCQITNFGVDFSSRPSRMEVEDCICRLASSRKCGDEKDAFVLFIECAAESAELLHFFQAAWSRQHQSRVRIGGRPFGQLAAEIKCEAVIPGARQIEREDAVGM